MYTDKEYLKKTIELLETAKAENKNAILYVNNDTFKQCIILKTDMLDKNREIVWIKNEICDFCYDYYANLAQTSGESNKFAKAASYFDRQDFVDKSPKEIYVESAHIAKTLGVSAQKVEETEMSL